MCKTECCHLCGTGMKSTSITVRADMCCVTLPPSSVAGAVIASSIADGGHWGTERLPKVMDQLVPGRAVSDSGSLAPDFALFPQAMSLCMDTCAYFLIYP